MSARQKWIIKDNKGRIQGSYTTDQVIDKITSGDLSGDEFISEFPGSDWHPISQDPQFYDKLLEVLARFSDPVIGEENDEFEEVKMKKNTSTPKRGQVKKIRSTQAPKKEEEEVIELSDKKKLKKQAAKKATKAPLIVIVIGLAALSAWLFSPTQYKRASHISLKVPSKKGEKLSKQQLKSLSKKTVTNYLLDTYGGYESAQSQTVKLLESYNKSPSNWALLCLIYLELWPYVAQNDHDLKAIKNAVAQVRQIEPEGMNAAICSTVDLIVNNRRVEANAAITSGLTVASKQIIQPVALYFLKARLMDTPKKAKLGVGYSQSAQRLWRGWTRAKRLEAELNLKTNNYQRAATIFTEIYKNNPQHSISAIQLGVLQYRSFNQMEKAQELLSTVLENDPKAPNSILAEGYLALAEISLRFKDTRKALRYAKKSYYYNPADPSGKNLMIQIGGKGVVKEAKADIKQLISEGNYFYRINDFITAFAHYKTAYEIDPTSAIAALKAGKCSWKMNFTTSAFKWLQLAIKADHKLIEAYIMLADYYAQRFDFSSAAQILAQASRVAPKSYEVYKGYGLVEYIRQNSEAAEGYLKRAVKLNGSDVETRVLLAKTYLDLDKYIEALNEVSIAIELDMNHREAQVVFAKALAGVEGFSSASSYLRSMIKAYPAIIDYRIALAEHYYSDDRFNEVQKLYEDIIDINNKSKKAFLGLGTVYKSLGSPQKALNSFLKASVLDPSDVAPVFEIGMLYLQVGKNKKAKKQFRKVVELNKRYPLIHYYLGQTHMQEKDYKGAIEQAQLERIQNPNLPHSFVLAAQAYYKLKQYNQCAREYQQAIRIEPNGSRSYIEMSKCFRLAGNLEIAIQMLNRAAQIESLPEIYKEQGAIYETEGEYDAAVKAYEKYLALNPGAMDRNIIERRISELQLPKEAI